MSSSISRLARFVVVAAAAVACERKTAAPSAVEAASSATPAPEPPARRERVEIPEVRIRPGAATVVRVRWSTPAGTTVNDDAPFRVRWNRSDGLVDAPNDVRATGSAVKDGFHVTVTPLEGAPNPTLGGEIDLVVCDAETHSVCVPVHRSLELGFIAVADAAREASVDIPLPQARPAPR